MFLLLWWWLYIHQRTCSERITNYLADSKFGRTVKVMTDQTKYTSWIWVLEWHVVLQGKWPHAPVFQMVKTYIITVVLITKKQRFSQYNLESRARLNTCVFCDMTLCRWASLLERLKPEDVGTAFLKNVGNGSPKDRGSCPRRRCIRKHSYTALFKLLKSKFTGTLKE